ncbi:EFR1 family ferrodoxin [Clostridioides difficile]
MRNVIYYFTGTVNSMRAAQVIAQELNNTEIISMRTSPSDYSKLTAERIGFIFPVYHWTIPETVIQFIKNLELSPDAYIFAISMPAFINGKSMEELALLLKEKGCNLSYGNKVYSVANYVAMYPPFPNPKKRVPKMEEQLRIISKEISQKEIRNYPKPNFLVNTLFHKIMNHYIKNCPSNDKYFKVWDDCISCGLCFKVCPCKNIIMQNGKPTFQHKCNQCMACISFCPKESINFPYFTRKRKKYHNPYISSNDIVLNRKYYK